MSGPQRRNGNPLRGSTPNHQLLIGKRTSYKSAAKLTQAPSNTHLYHSLTQWSLKINWNKNSCLSLENPCQVCPFSRQQVEAIHNPNYFQNRVILQEHKGKCASTMEYLGYVHVAFQVVSYQCHSKLVTFHPVNQSLLVPGRFIGPYWGIFVSTMQIQATEHQNLESRDQQTVAIQRRHVCIPPSQGNQNIP